MSTRGERIREALAARGVRKQQALAAELNVHESAITRWKENKPISLDSAVAFCAALDVSLDWLLLGRGTIDSHRSHPAPTGSPGDETMQRIAQRVGPRSLTLLLSFVDSIADASGS
jgi:transcriptional regulator with XRE-family HTH domain